MTSIKVGDQTIAYKRLGSGQPMIVINGFAATKADWDPEFIETLSQRHDLVLIDNRGMGESSGPATAFTVKDLAGDVIGVMDSLDIDNATIVGWSMGGFVALDLAHNHPERVKKLVLLSTTAGGSQLIPSSTEVHDSLRDLTGTPHEQASRLISLLFTPPRAAVIESEFGDLVASARAALNLDVIRQQIAIIDNWERDGFEGSLNAIKQPVLVAAGSNDVVFPVQNSAQMASAIPGAWLAQFPDSAHAFMADYPDQLAELIQLFDSTS